HVLGRDADGRVLAREETVTGVTRTFDYSYDAIGRLTDVTIDATPTEHYEYDANGNRLGATRPVGDVDAHFDVQDRMVDQGANTYIQNADGALATKVNSQTGNTVYEYDIAGNLLGVTLPSGDIIEYVVDASGHRLGRKLNGNLTNRWIYGVDAG